MTKELLGTELWCQVCKHKVALFRGQRKKEIANNVKCEVTSKGLVIFSYKYQGYILVCKGKHPDGNMRSKAIEVYV